MPYKMYCDRCGKETDRNYISNRAIFVFEEWTAEVMIAREGHYNQGILCVECLDRLLRHGALSQKRDVS
jgi:hypothetical protein